MKPVFALIVSAVLLFSACSNSSEWTDADRESFIQECVAHAAGVFNERTTLEYCECMLEKTESSYETLEASEHMTSFKAEQILEECLVDMGYYD